MLDILIIGAGGAGLSAALKANEYTKNILVVSKTFPTQSQTVQAQGGINAVLEEENDSKQNHTQDTYISSKKLANINNIELMCNTAKDTIKWLDKLGVPFSRTSTSKIAQRYFGGTKHKRTCYSSDFTGLKIMHTLYDNCLKNGIKFLNEYHLLELIKVKDKIIGAKFLNIKTTEIKNIYAKKVILASGGYSNIYYNHSTNSTSTTGDGIALAYKAGAKLSNIEFVQFHPTALIGSNTLISEAARALGGYLIDEDGNRFVDELSTRDIVSRYITDKIIEGKKVYLDMRHIDKELLYSSIPQEIKIIKELLNLSLEKDLIPINPAAHYTMGGIYTNVSCETSIKNLYACGEVAQANIHGANRLGGNSLLEIIYLGKNAAKNAYLSITNEKIEETNTNEKVQDNMIKNILSKPKMHCIYKIREELGQNLFKFAGIYKNKKDLTSIKTKIEKWQKEYENTGIEDKSRIYNKNLLDYIELGNLLLVSKIVIESSLKREESRGSHYRTDNKKMKKEFEKISIIEKDEEKIIVKYEKIV